MQHSTWRFLLFFLVFSIFTSVAQTQTERKFYGRVMIGDTEIGQVNITNERSGKSTQSGENGEFKIDTRIGDTLIFTAVNLETKQVFTNAELIQIKPVVIKMSYKVNSLPEITVSQIANVNAVSLGIIPANQKKYSPAERRVREATTGGGIVPLNPILNAISGRTKMLKKEVLVEGKERLLLALDGWFEADFYLRNLKLTQEDISGFHYFIIDDAGFVRALRAKNKTLTKFLAKPLAIKYNQILIEESK